MATRPLAIILGETMTTFENRLDDLEKRIRALEEKRADATGNWLTIQEAADYLAVHPNTLRRYVSEGKLRGYRSGGIRDLRFRREDLDASLVAA
jgi:excisionase family DNA binding protein